MRARKLDPTRKSTAAELLEAGLRSKIVGQDDAIHQVVEMYQIYLSGMSSPGRPIANLMFLGPTGSGKTRVVEALAECLLENSGAVVKVDCGEFQHSHEIAKLIGSPPGYLGHRDTSPVLTQEALDRYHTPNVKLSIVLFDEIEKASDMESDARNSGQGDFNPRRQQQSGLLQNNGFHDQQYRCPGDERTNEAAAGLQRRSPTK
jgi:ATP-dependent Clp protease ATP-binding subunit ClpA